MIICARDIVSDNTIAKEYSFCERNFHDLAFKIVASRYGKNKDIDYEKLGKSIRIRNGEIVMFQNMNVSKNCEQYLI